LGTKSIVVMQLPPRYNDYNDVRCCRPGMRGAKRVSPYTRSPRLKIGPESPGKPGSVLPGRPESWIARPVPAQKRSLWRRSQGVLPRIARIGGLEGGESRQTNLARYGTLSAPSVPGKDPGNRAPRAISRDFTLAPRETGEARALGVRPLGRLLALLALAGLL